MGTTLVTGATGNVGREVLRLLQAAGAPCVAAVRDPQRAAKRLGDAALVRFDFTDEATHAAALSGVERVFLVRPPDLANPRRDMAPFLAAARRAGVQQIVFLSLLGAERNPLVPHHTIETLLRATGIGTTLLRPSFFMQNLDTTHRLDIRDRDQIYVPAGDGRTSFIDARDIAAVAVRCLTEPGHSGAGYALTGAAALTYSEVAAIFTEVLGRPISYPDPDALAFSARMHGYGHPAAEIAVMVAIYTTARLGLAATVTDTLAALLGREPTTVRQYVQDYRRVWE